MDDSIEDAWSDLRQKIQVEQIMAGIVVSLLLVGVAYWFGIRPYRIHRYCENFAIKASSGASQINTFELNNTYPGIYEACLNNHGL